jgi:hypothetical protein
MAARDVPKIAGGVTLGSLLACTACDTHHATDCRCDTADPRDADCDAVSCGTAVFSSAHACEELDDVEAVDLDRGGATLTGTATASGSAYWKVRVPRGRTLRVAGSSGNAQLHVTEECGAEATDVEPLACRAAVDEARTFFIEGSPGYNKGIGEVADATWEVCASAVKP